ncbi:hypothetical protein GFS24_25950 [Chitinophaga sp. SYP-B3965]|uniref:hypothetical protein n=1 Tax=Chitinophaga sp. SYP-B3965 TaxID=2663120 RepID=UPI001299CEEC|nr:hypothetical protein [Chitinophaga sp. SYP-B3965]MRG48587.1 hypothetical protein [Chitinophaga sp. SYP-B3965]
MYNVKPNLIFGFHGCDAQVRDSLLKNPDVIRISKEPFDWLGHGMYFWENNIERAMQWAIEKKRRGTIKDPAVIGAILNLGYCCDFLDSHFIETLKDSHQLMSAFYNQNGISLPVNKNAPNDANNDKLLRELDCAVIEFMHEGKDIQAKRDLSTHGFLKNLPFDSTRSVFTEGAPAYEGAGIHDKNHIQICIRNMNCIKGFFIPRSKTNFLEYLKTA